MKKMNKNSQKKYLQVWLSDSSFKKSESLYLLTQVCKLFSGKILEFK